MTDGAGAPGAVLVVGDVIDDIVVRPQGPITHDSDTRAQIARREGGSAANLSSWLARAGASVTFVGKVAQADVARHTAALADFGVQAHLAGDPHDSTGSIVILVDEDGARTMFTDRAANLNLVPADVPAGLVEHAGLLHLSGYSFVEDGVRQTAMALMKQALEAGVPVSVDPSSSAFLAEVGPQSFLEWTAGASLSFPNLDEAKVLTGLTDTEAAAIKLSESYDLVVVTCGLDGAILASDGVVLGHVEGESVPVVDTTGAGDAFCAGFLASWGADQSDPLAAAAHGIKLASNAVGRMGARPPRPGAPDQI